MTQSHISSFSHAPSLSLSLFACVRACVPVCLCLSLCLHPLPTRCSLHVCGKPLQVWDPITYRNVSGLPQPRAFHAMASVARSIFIYGGRSRNRGPLGDVWKFDTHSLLWERLVESAFAVCFPLLLSAARAVACRLSVMRPLSLSLSLA